MRGWWWRHTELGEMVPGTKKRERIKSLHFSEFQGATALCGQVAPSNESSQFNKASQPAGVMPDVETPLCSKCVEAVIAKATGKP